MIEANTKHGSDMAHIILKEEELPFPPIKLAAPKTLLADIEAARNSKLEETWKYKPTHPCSIRGMTIEINKKK